jgi:post-segregation antitoxin (ccd killing protein)
MADSIASLVSQARQTLGLRQQKDLARFIGCSTRTIQRHADTSGVFYHHHHTKLVAALLAVDPALAAKYARATRVNLSTLTAAASSPAVRRPPAREDALTLISEAADALNLPPRSVKPVLSGLFAKAKALGVDLNGLVELFAAEVTRARD